jgi:hypothetical protein
MWNMAILKTNPIYKWFHPELAAWVVAVFFLGFFPPSDGSTSLCLLDYYGWWCPGEGLGRAISHTLHMNWMTSLQTHPLGIPVTLYLLIRIVQLISNIVQRNIYTYANTKIST